MISSRWPSGSWKYRPRPPSRWLISPPGPAGIGPVGQSLTGHRAERCMARMSEQPGLTVPVVWSEDCLRHEPGGEVWLGVRDQGTEVPARALILRDALAAAGAPIVPARPHGDEI